jgi:flagellar assembly protein FliH
VGKIQLSYNVIKKNCVNSNSTYTVKAPVILLKKEEPRQDIDMEPVYDPQKIIDDAKKQAEKIINDAVTKSRSLLNTAEIEIGRIKKETYETSHLKGYEEGFKKGSKEGLQSVENIKNEASDLLKDAHRLSREYISSQKGEIINLALYIADKVIGYQSEVNDSIIVKIVNDAIDNAVLKGQLVIRVNPLDYAILDCKRDELYKTAGENTIVNIIKDNDIRRGGCILETESSYVDAQIDTQLEKIKEALLG